MKDTAYKHSHILNGDINEKKKTLKQIKINNRIRDEEKEHCDPVV